MGLLENEGLSMLRTSTYGALATQIRDGKIFVPDFQRSYVWSKNDAIALFDSILTGIPIGGQVILWDTAELGREVLSTKRDQVKGFVLPENTRKRRMIYVLDGQQRILTYLFVVYRDFFKNSYHKRFDIAVAIDWDENGFKIDRVCAYDEKDPDQYLIRDIVNAYSASERYKKNNPDATEEDIQDFVEFANAIANRINRADAPVTTVETEDISLAAKIFEKINLSGKSLSETDILHAMLRSQEIVFEDMIKVFIDDMEMQAFFSGDKVKAQTLERLVSKCLAVSSGYSDGTATRKDMFGAIDKVILNNQSKLVSERTSECTTAAINFLRAHICPGMNGDFLPLHGQFVMLTYFFYCLSSNYGHYRVSEKQRSELVKWFWRSSFGQRYTGISSRTMRHDADNMRKLAIDGNSDLSNIPVDLATLGDMLREGPQKQDSVLTAVKLFLLKSKGAAAGNVGKCTIDTICDKASDAHYVANMIILSEEETRVKEANSSKEFLDIAMKTDSEFVFCNMLPAREGTDEEWLEVRLQLIKDSIVSFLDNPTRKILNARKKCLSSLLTS